MLVISFWQSNLWGHWYSDWSKVWPCHRSLSRLQGLQEEMLINNVIVVSSCVLGGRVGRLRASICTWVCFVRHCIVYAHAWLCMHSAIQAAASHLPLFSPIHWDPQPVPTSLIVSSRSFLRRAAEGDICSVRECPNYSWSFNHSGFGLCSICGVSHKCAPAALVNGSFMNVVLCSV